MILKFQFGRNEVQKNNSIFKIAPFLAMTILIFQAFPIGEDENNLQTHTKGGD